MFPQSRYCIHILCRHTYFCLHSPALILIPIDHIYRMFSECCQVAKVNTFEVDVHTLIVIDTEAKGSTDVSRVNWVNRS